MRRQLAIGVGAAVCLATGLVGVLPPAQAAGPGIHVSNGRLVERNGTDLVLRGINHAHTWYTSQTGSFAGIKAAGANSVRVVLSNGVRWTKNSASDVTGVINLCTTNKLICVLEVHDTTGYGEQSGATTLAKAADYWVELKKVLAGQEDHVLINIGNEPYGNNGYQTWATDTSAAIKKIRDAGLAHTIVVDAPNWGQDWSFTMRDNAPAVLAADPTGNTMFSIHMYGVFDTAAEVKAYLDAFTSKKLPIMVGEFGNQHSDGDPDENTIMSYTASQRLGMMGWSWSGNSSDVGYLDMVNNFQASSLTSWGARFIDGANGLRTGTKEATIYGGVQP
ncbi:MAG: mannan endo,4-beta-mannosidase, partial [Actinomycetota bacterium]|nr:mannan endo,4-beta-mannosidase [Actinomycetota bacterium]